MTPPDAGSLLRAWEHGATQTPALRALLLLQAASPGDSPESLAALSIGHRDAMLINLRERLFGPTIVGLTRCPHCREAIELDFPVRDIRVAHAKPGTSFALALDGREVGFRVPNSSDLVALQVESDSAAARRHLLARCLLDGAAPDELPPEWEDVVGDRMAMLDPQAEVLLDLGCPSCGGETQAPFEIENYLWVEVERWARDLMYDVHVLARAYGWSEADILSMSGTRRRGYLELIAA